MHKHPTRCFGTRILGVDGTTPTPPGSKDLRLSLRPAITIAQPGSDITVAIVTNVLPSGKCRWCLKREEKKNKSKQNKCLKPSGLQGKWVDAASECWQDPSKEHLRRSPWLKASGWFKALDIPLCGARVDPIHTRVKRVLPREDPTGQIFEGWWEHTFLPSLEVGKPGQRSPPTEASPPFPGVGSPFLLVSTFMLQFSS